MFILPFTSLNLFYCFLPFFENNKYVYNDQNPAADGEVNPKRNAYTYQSIKLFVCRIIYAGRGLKKTVNKMFLLIQQISNIKKKIYFKMSIFFFFVAIFILKEKIE